MAHAFSQEQLREIRERLLESARRHALDTGVKKTSLDTLTAEAGIAKSSFYKFFGSKEQLFLEVASGWERQSLAQAARALDTRGGSKARAAAFVFAVFESIHQMGLARFLREDLPYLRSFFPEEMAKSHCLASSRSIFERLRAADIRFTEPDDVVLSVIQLMYLSILHIEEIGEPFFPALHALVQSACDRLVA